MLIFFSNTNVFNLILPNYNNNNFEFHHDIVKEMLCVTKTCIDNSTYILREMILVEEDGHLAIDSASQWAQKSNKDNGLAHI